MPSSNKKAIGLDIADRSATVAELTDTENGLAVSARARVALAAGIVERGRIKDVKKLAAALQEAFAKADFESFDERTEIVFGIPESQIYFHIFDLPPHDRGERELLVKKTAESNIPLPADDLAYTYSVLREEEGAVQIILVGASRKIMMEWRDFFKATKLNVGEAFDIEPLAVRRGVMAESPAAPVCVADIGAVTSSIYIFDALGLRYTYSVLTAGDSFTHEVAVAAKTSWEEAEALKERLGLQPDDNRILGVLVKAIEPLRDELKTAIDYYQSNFGQKLSEVILVGGSSRLKGLTEYFSANLEVPVRLGAPMAGLMMGKKTPAKTSAKRISKSKALAAAAPADDSFYYIEAIGLARRGFSGWWDKDPLLNPSESHDISAAGSVLTKVERMLEKEEKIVEQTVKRVWLNKKLIIGLAAFGVIAFGAVYGYRFYKSMNGAGLEKKPTGLVNRDAPSLVFPERAMDGMTVNQDNDSLAEPLRDEESASEGQTPSDGAEESSPPVEPPLAAGEDIDMVLILDTPTDWLNVRAGPGTNFAILTKVYPGQSYPLLQESGKWYKIRLDLDTEGWVINQYAAKQ